MFVIIIILKITIISFSVSGIVKDSVTQEPIPNIKINLNEVFCYPGGHGCSYRYYKSEIITDKNGKFELSPKIIFRSWIFYNDNSLYLNHNAFSNYHIREGINKEYSASNARIESKKFLSLIYREDKDYTIFLPPIVDSLSECNKERLCVWENSLSLAYRNNNEDLCFNLPSPRTKIVGLKTEVELNEVKSYSSVSECLTNLAVANTNILICQKMNNGENIKICEDYVQRILSAEDALLKCRTREINCNSESLIVNNREGKNGFRARDLCKGSYHTNREENSCINLFIEKGFQIRDY